MTDIHIKFENLKKINFETLLYKINMQYKILFIVIF